MLFDFFEEPARKISSPRERELISPTFFAQPHQHTKGTTEVTEKEQPQKTSKT